jgi:hypothetical protein
MKNLKNIFYKFPRRFKINESTPSDDVENIAVSPEILKTLQEKKMLYEAQEREQIRKTQAFAKRREEEIRKGNRKMLLNMKVPNVVEKPEK